MSFVNYAHRGASSYAPENTLMSFYLGMIMGADGIETDVQLTKDGVPVLFHDDTIVRMTGEEGSICDYTFEELLKFNVSKYGLFDKIVTFEDFLKHFYFRDITFAIELKGKGTAKATADLLRKYNMVDKTIVTSFRYSELVDIRAYAPEFRTGYLTDEIDDELLAKMKKDGITQICPKAKDLTKEDVDNWRSMGFEVRPWGIKDTDIMERVYSYGVDGMTVNFPDKLKELMDK